MVHLYLHFGQFNPRRNRGKAEHFGIITEQDDDDEDDDDDNIDCRHTLLSFHPFIPLCSHPLNSPCLLKGSPFRAWSRSEYSQACFIYCQGFLPG